MVESAVNQQLTTSKVAQIHFTNWKPQKLIINKP